MAKLWEGPFQNSGDEGELRGGGDHQLRVSLGEPVSERHLSIILRSTSGWFSYPNVGRDSQLGQDCRVEGSEGGGAELFKPGAQHG